MLVHTLASLGLAPRAVRGLLHHHPLPDMTHERLAWQRGKSSETRADASNGWLGPGYGASVDLQSSSLPRTRPHGSRSPRRFTAPVPRPHSRRAGSANMTRAQRHNGQLGAQPSRLQRIPAADSVLDSCAKHPARRGAWRRVRTDVRLHLVKSEC